MQRSQMLKPFNGRLRAALISLISREELGLDDPVSSIFSDDQF